MHLDSRKMINLSTTFTNGLKIIIDRLSGENREKTLNNCGKLQRICFEGCGNFTLLKLIFEICSLARRAAIANDR